MIYDIIFARLSCVIALCYLFFLLQFHLLDPLKFLLGVAMIRNVLIGMPAFILDAQTLVHLTLVQLKHSVAPITTKLDALVLKVGLEIRKGNAYLVRYTFFSIVNLFKFNNWLRHIHKHLLFIHPDFFQKMVVVWCARWKGGKSHNARKDNIANWAKDIRASADAWKVFKYSKIL